MIFRVAAISLVVLPILSILGNPIDNPQDLSLAQSEGLPSLNKGTPIDEMDESALSDNKESSADINNHEISEASDPVNSADHQKKSSAQPENLSFIDKGAAELNAVALSAKKISEVDQSLTNVINNTVTATSTAAKLGKGILQPQLSGVEQTFKGAIHNGIPLAQAASKLCNGEFLKQLPGIGASLSNEANPLITVTIEVHTIEVLNLPARTLNHQPIKIEFVLNSMLGRETKSIEIPLPWDIQGSNFNDSGLSSSISDGSFWKIIPSFDSCKQKSTKPSTSIPKPVPCETIPWSESFCDLAKRFTSYLYDIWNNSLPCAL